MYHRQDSGLSRRQTQRNCQNPGDGELMLTELGLEGDEQAEKRFTAGQTERCVIILVSIISTGAGIPGTGGVVCCACVW